MKTCGNLLIRILVVLGTRPEAIKLLPVIREIKKNPHFQLHLAITGQHREIAEQILESFDIKADSDLDIMRPGQSLNEIVFRILPKLEKLLWKESPDLVLVQGDTTSAFCAALAAFHHQIPVGHVEAGLRSFNRQHPYPEEANRRMISSLTDLHFAPTPQSRDNLLQEGISTDAIHVTGNTVVDALFMALNEVKRPFVLFESLKIDKNCPLVLVTLHRRESWLAKGGSVPIEQTFEAIRNAATRFPKLNFVFPMHYNPEVRTRATRLLGDQANIHLIEPLSYFDFVHLMTHASLILTDSGGIQEEAPSLGVPVLITRETTERPEGLLYGTSQLIGITSSEFCEKLAQMIELFPMAKRNVPLPNPFGDGKAAKRIVEAILYFMNWGKRPEAFLGCNDLEKGAAPK